MTKTRITFEQVNTQGAYSGFSGRELMQSIGFNSDKLIKSVYDSERRKELINGSPNTVTVVLPENSADAEQLCKAVEQFAIAQYKPYAVGNFLKSGFFSPKMQIYGEESLCAEIIDAELEDTAALLYELFKELSVSELMIKDGKENRVLLACL